MSIAGVGRGAYDPVLKLESVRLYGNIASYAYYYVDLTIGTPAQRVSVILDTGSGLLAFPCSGCRHCGEQRDPLFDISKSGTAQSIPCGSEGGAGKAACRGDCSSGHCTYKQANRRREGSSISGYWFEDLVRLGDAEQHNPPIRAPMGCQQNEGVFGIQGAESPLNDLFRDSSRVDSRVFSICLAAEGGRLTVGGANATHHTGKVGYTSQIGDGYGVNLMKVTINGGVIDGFGNTVIDSWSAYTVFNKHLYRKIISYVEDACMDDRCRATKSDRGCWTDAKGLAHFPSMDFEFEGVTVKWNPREYLYTTDSISYCYAFKDGGGTMTTLGASWMLYKDVIFDLAGKRIGIVPAECPGHKAPPAPDGRPAPVPSEIVPSNTRVRIMDDPTRMLLLCLKYGYNWSSQVTHMNGQEYVVHDIVDEGIIRVFDQTLLDRGHQDGLVFVPLECVTRTVVGGGPPQAAPPPAGTGAAPAPAPAAAATAPEGGPPQAAPPPAGTGAAPAPAPAAAATAPEGGPPQPVPRTSRPDGGGATAVAQRPTWAASQESAVLFDPPFPEEEILRLLAKVVVGFLVLGALSVLPFALCTRSATEGHATWEGEGILADSKPPAAVVGQAA